MSKWVSAALIASAMVGLSGCTNPGNEPEIQQHFAARQWLAGSIRSEDCYCAANQQMFAHFDAALTEFEADVRSGKAAARVVRNNERPDSPIVDVGHSSPGRTQ